MATDHAPAGGSSPQGFRDLTAALLGGLVAASFMFFLIAAVQTPGLDPPPETAALFVIVTTGGIVSWLLVRAGHPAGYPAVLLTVGGVLATVGLVLLGTYGPAGDRTNPVGPVSYVALALAVAASAGLAWRRATPTDRAPGSRAGSARERE